MNPNLTELIFILDRSGSMQHLTTETIGGFNSLVEKQRNAGDALLTTVLFDNSYELLHDHMDISKVPPLTENEYFARGSTALLDAIGKTIDSVGIRLANTSEEERPGKVIFTITTDGYENASCQYSLSKIKEMITRQRTIYKWEFVFLGANIDAIETAEALGISQKMAKTYSASSVGCSSTFHVMDKLLSFMKFNSRDDDDDDDFDDDCETILSEIE